MNEYKKNSAKVMADILRNIEACLSGDQSELVDDYRIELETLEDALRKHYSESELTDIKIEAIQLSNGFWYE
jgi:hypothetical protein